jgi:hypothetical protein
MALEGDTGPRMGVSNLAGDRGEMPPLGDTGASG